MKHSNNFPFCAKKTFSKASGVTAILLSILFVVGEFVEYWIPFGSLQECHYASCIAKKAYNFPNVPNKNFAVKEDLQASIITRFST